MSINLKYSFVIFFVFVVFSSLILLASVTPKYQKKEKAVVYGMNDAVSFDDFNEEEFAESRKIDAKNLVEKAAQYLEKNDLGKAMREFSTDKKFVLGELYLFAYDADGVCLLHGQAGENIWQNGKKYKDALGFPAVQMIIDKANAGGGWINFQHRNANKICYIKSVQKGEKKIILGSGFYPLSKRDAVVSLVKNAVEDFNKSMKAGALPNTAFSEFSNPIGRFIFGDLYLFALNFDGTIVAQGDLQGLIGTNALDKKDESGKLINREIIDQLKEKDTGVWIEYISKGARKLTYAEKVVDRDGNRYFIACGYYPETSRKAAVELVEAGSHLMLTSGLGIAIKAFEATGKNEYKKGDLFLFVYEYGTEHTGRCIAHGENSDLKGANNYNEKDENGKYPVRMLIDKAKAGGGWINYMVRHSYLFTYVESVEVAGIKYAVGCGIFPSSKPETMQLIVKDAAGSVRDIGAEQSFEKFVEKDGKFVKGDIEVFVFDVTDDSTSGLCYVYGSDNSMVWKDMLTAKDDDGRPFVKLIVNTAKDGSGTVVYRENKKLKAAYVMKVDKDNKSYAVGSSIYIDGRDLKVTNVAKPAKR